MNQKFLEDAISHEVTDDLLDESYHVNFDVTTDADKFILKVTAKNTKNGQYILYGLNNAIAGTLREIGKNYEIPVSELIKFITDSVLVLEDKELNDDSSINVVFENE